MMTRGLRPCSQVHLCQFTSLHTRVASWREVNGHNCTVPPELGGKIARAQVTVTSTLSDAIVHGCTPLDVLDRWVMVLTPLLIFV